MIVRPKYIFYLVIIILITLFIFVKKLLKYTDNTDYSPNTLNILNKIKHKNNVTKVTSFDFRNCQLTWVEEWHWSPQRFCIAPNQQLKSAVRIDMSKIDAKTGISIRRQKKFDVVTIYPENFKSLAFGPVPRIKNTEKLVSEAVEAYELLESEPNAIANYLQMCVTKPRVSYAKSKSIYSYPHSKGNDTDELIDAFKYYADKC